MRVKFNDTRQLTKVFIVRNLGILREMNAPPSDYNGITPIWNLNLPIFKQKEGWEINVFQSNYRKFTKAGAKISAGTKTLTYLGIVGASNNSTKSGARASAGEASGAGSTSGNKTKSGSNDEGGAIFLYRDSETGISQRFVFNLRYYKGAGGGPYGVP